MENEHEPHSEPRHISESLDPEQLIPAAEPPTPEELDSRDRQEEITAAEGEIAEIRARFRRGEASAEDGTRMMDLINDIQAAKAYYQRPQGGDLPPQ